MILNKNSNLFYAIVLKSSTNLNSKAIIFEKDQGKIEVLIRDNSKKNLLNGSLIDYECVLWRDKIIIKKSSFIYLPEILSTDNLKLNKLLFVHHWLEIANIFLEYNQPNIKIYNLFFVLYNLSKIKSITGQKLIIAHFFTLLGIYPVNADNLNNYNSNFLHLILGSLDTMFEIEDDVQLNKKLNQWIYDCIKVHPKAKWIKTLDFLK